MFRWALLAVLTVGVTVPLTMLGVPSAALFAALVVGVALALLTLAPAGVPRPAGLAAQGVLGVYIGTMVQRDALSALDQLLATGSIAQAQPEFDPLFHALANADAQEALTSLSALTREGWDPEQLAESFSAELTRRSIMWVAERGASIGSVAGGLGSLVLNEPLRALAGRFGGLLLTALDPREAGDRERLV